MHYLILILALLWTVPALGQSSVNTVDTIADLLRLKPNRERPLWTVLGNTAKNDGGGGDYVWMEASTAATNTVASQAGGPIAWPYGSAAGRWVKRVTGKPSLNNAVVTGDSRIPSGSSITVEPGAGVVGSIGSVVVFNQAIIGSNPFDETNPAAATTKLYVDNMLPAVVQNLAELKALNFRYQQRRLAVVLSDTGNDGASGDWYWEPGSTATATVVCVASDITATGRWFKR